MVESYYSCKRGMISRERNSAVKEKQRVGKHCQIVGENRTCCYYYWQINSMTMNITMMSSVAYLLELIIRTFVLGAMCSNIVIITLEQQVDVFDELVRDNRVEVNFTLAANGMDNGASNDSHTDITVDSIVH